MLDLVGMERLNKEKKNLNYQVRHLQFNMEINNIYLITGINIFTNR